MDEDGNIFAQISVQALSKNEQVDELLARPEIKVERIVSMGHASAPDFWYEQDWEEWVIVLSGEARLRFEEEQDPRTLSSGDYVFRPAKARHRVDWTRPDQPTVWLAATLAATGVPAERHPCVVGGPQNIGRHF
jgi:cupin 2 domain-containing protein